MATVNNDAKIITNYKPAATSSTTSAGNTDAILKPNSSNNNSQTPVEDIETLTQAAKNKNTVIEIAEMMGLKKEDVEAFIDGRCFKILVCQGFKNVEPFFLITFFA